MIIIAGGIKGGSGKTTVATNLAVIRAGQGRDVLLVDADDQETATDFTNLRNERGEGTAQYTGIKLTGAAVRTEILRLAPKYQDIIIDTGGRDTSSQRAALSVADVLLVPFGVYSRNGKNRTPRKVILEKSGTWHIAGQKPEPEER